MSKSTKGKKSKKIMSKSTKGKKSKVGIPKEEGIENIVKEEGIENIVEVFIISTNRSDVTGIVEIVFSDGTSVELGGINPKLYKEFEDSFNCPADEDNPEGWKKRSMYFYETELKGNFTIA